MRHIPLKKQQPDPKWLKRAGAALKALETAPDAAARKKIIDRKSKVWGDLKTWLLEMSHGKCWFSEAKEIFSNYDVEHYRPKKTAKDEDGTEHDGYWWLAFDWRNFRVCGNVGNTKKGTFFPLHPGCARVINIVGDLRLENPKMLDPTDEDDPNLLSFNFEGMAIPVAGLTGWDRERVEYSVKRMNLDFPPLLNKRKAVWAECHQRIEAYRTELIHLENSGGRNQIAFRQVKENAKAIREMMQADRELSAVARACVLSTGDRRVMGLLQSS
jgi:uncharacterized protein (TIGR02646 family)